MGSATDCPSKKLGLCKVGSKCYALKAENMYPQCKPYRDRQAKYWLNTDTEDIINDFTTLFTRHKRALRKVKYFRFNEAGDFYSDACITKLNTIAYYLKAVYGVITYGYTARTDLFKHFTPDSLHFIVRISRGFSKRLTSLNGFPSTYVINSPKNLLLSVSNLCPGNCRTCNYCKITKGDVVFICH